MASSSTALDAECIEEDDGLSEPALTEAHVRDIFSHWEAGAQAAASSCASRHGCHTLLTLQLMKPVGHSSLLSAHMRATQSDHPADNSCICRAASALC